MSEVSLGGMGDALYSLVREFVQEADYEVGEAVEAAGEVGAETLRGISPKRRGRYASGWVSDYEGSQFGSHEAVMHNEAVPGLTHLLEFGHEQFVYGRDTGRRTPGQPHIEAGYEAAVAEFNRRLGT